MDSITNRYLNEEAQYIKKYEGAYNRVKASFFYSTSHTIEFLEWLLDCAYTKNSDITTKVEELFGIRPTYLSSIPQYLVDAYFDDPQNQEYINKYVVKLMEDV